MDPESDDDCGSHQMVHSSNRTNQSKEAPSMDGDPKLSSGSDPEITEDDLDIKKVQTLPFQSMDSTISHEYCTKDIGGKGIESQHVRNIIQATDKKHLRSDTNVSGSCKDHNSETKDFSKQRDEVSIPLHQQSEPEQGLLPSIRLIGPVDSSATAAKVRYYEHERPVNSTVPSEVTSSEDSCAVKILDSSGTTYDTSIDICPEFEVCRISDRDVDAAVSSGPDVCPRLWLCRAAITADLRPQDVLDQLIQEEAVNGDDVERMERRPTTSGRAAALLDLLLVHKGPAACRALLDALRDVYAHLYQLVTHTSVTHMHRRRFLAYVAQRKAHVRGQLTHEDYHGDNHSAGFQGSEDQVDLSHMGRKDQHLETDMMGLLKSELSDFYKQTLKTIRPIAWNDEVLLNMYDYYSDVVIMDITKATSSHSSMSDIGMFGINIPGQGSGKSVSKITDIKMMFQEENESFRRILLEGEPGMGKSTFCSKLALDCSSRKRIEEQDWLQNFQYVILISADLLEESLTSAMTNHLLAEDTVGIEAAQLELQFMDPVIQTKTLLILDAYDEAANCDLIHDIWNGKIMRKCTVLITCRVGRCPSLMRSMDKRCILRGFTRESRTSFITQYQLDAGITADLLADVEDAEMVLGHVTYIPLYLSLLCLLLDEREEAIPDTKTKLLQEVVSLMVSRTAAKLNIEEDGIDSQTLEKYAFDSLCNPSLAKTCQLLRKDSGNIGVLYQEKSKSRLKPKTTVRFVHKVLQEFMSAKYLVSLPHTEMVESLKAFVDEESKISIVVFLAGLYGDCKREQLYQLYTDVICKDLSTLKERGVREKHSDYHTGLQCLAETGYFDNFEDIMTTVVPMQMHFESAGCCPCLKGFSIASDVGNTHSYLILNPDDLSQDITQCELFKKQLSKIGKFSSVVIKSDMGLMVDTLPSLVFYLPSLPSLYHLHIHPSMAPGTPTRSSPKLVNLDEEMKSICQSHPAELKSLIVGGARSRLMSGGAAVIKTLDIMLENLSLLIKPSLRLLVLEEMTISFSNSSDLLDRITKNGRHLQALCLDTVAFDFGVFQMLGVSLFGCSNLKYLEVQYCFECELPEEESSSAEHTTFRPQRFVRESVDLPKEFFQLMANSNLEKIIICKQKADWSLLGPSLQLSLPTLTYLDLSFTSLTSENLMSLAYALQESYVIDLILKGLVVDVESLVSLLVTMNRVQNLDLSYNDIGGKDKFPTFCEGFIGKTMLKRLSLAACGITDDTVGCLWTVFESIQLEHLDLEANELMTSEDAFYQITALLSLCSGTLISLIIPMSCFTVERFDGFLTMLQAHAHLRNFRIIIKISQELMIAQQCAHLPGNERFAEKLKRLLPQVKDWGISMAVDFMETRNMKEKSDQNRWRELQIRYC